MKRQLVSGLFTLLLLVSAGNCPAEHTSFTGTWKQSNDRSRPVRQGDVTLHIQDRDSQLTVETTVLRHGAAPQYATQRYTTDGKPSVSTGADGDEFHTKVIRRGSALYFSSEEHEDGRILRSVETWTLLEQGALLERRREREGRGSQSIIYLREGSKP